MAIKNILKKYLASPLLLIAIVFFFLAGFFYFTSRKSIQILPKQTEQDTKHVLSIVKTPTITLTVSKTPSVQQKTSLPTVTTHIINPTNTSIPQPTNTPLPQAESSNKSVDTLSIQINEPDGNSGYSLTFHDGSNPCSILNDAKNEGKLKSVTIMHYGAPLNSDYVKELNGYQDNWTFTLNGESKPKGCSNYTLNKGDTVTWKYN